MSKLMPGVKPIVEFRNSIQDQVAVDLNSKDVKPAKVSHPTIFHDIIQSTLPTSEKSLDRLTEEALSVVGGWTETRKWVLTIATFHLLEHGPAREKLQAELAEVMPDSSKILPYDELEKLPFLR